MLLIAIVDSDDIESANRILDQIDDLDRRSKRLSSKVVKKGSQEFYGSSFQWIHSLEVATLVA